MPNSETCDYCHKRLPANTGRLCDECEASLFCHVCGTSLKNKSWAEFYPDKFYCDPCTKKEQANLDANIAEILHHLSLEKHMIVVVSQEVCIWSKTARGRNDDTIKPPQKIF